MLDGVAVPVEMACLCFIKHTATVLLELTELAKPVERPCLCCNTQQLR